MSWSGLVLDSAISQAQKGLRGDARRAAVEALEQFRPLGPAIEKRSPALFTQVVGLTVLGETGRAQALWLRDAATEDEAWGAFAEAIDKAEGAAAERAQEWGDFWAAVGRAGLIGLRYALPFLLLAAG